MLNNFCRDVPEPAASALASATSLPTDLVLSEPYWDKNPYFFLFPCSLFPVSCSLFPVPCSLFPVPCFLFPVPFSLFPVPCSLIPRYRTRSRILPRTCRIGVIPLCDKFYVPLSIDDPSIGFHNLSWFLSFSLFLNFRSFCSCSCL